jgi:iron(III) transport system permease protein
MGNGRHDAEFQRGGIGVRVTAADRGIKRPGGWGSRRLTRWAQRQDGGWALAVGFVLAVLVALPILSVVSNLARTSNGNFTHLATTVMPSILGNTAAILALVALGCGVIGTGCAWLVTMHTFPGSRAFQWLLLLPMAMPAYIIGYAYTDALTYAGPVQSSLRSVFGWSKGDYWFPDIHSLGGLSAMLTLVLYPYVYFLVRTAFLEQSVTALDVARSLGHGAMSRFFRVALPLARPALAAGLALAMMEALADFGTVQYFGIQTFTTAIYRTWFGLGDRVGAGQLASGLLVFVLVLVSLERAARRQSRFHRSNQKDMPVVPGELTGWWAAGAIGACALPVLLGFVVPVLVLVRLHVSDGDDVWGSRFGVLAWNSFSIAALAALVVSVAAAIVAYAMRLSRGRFAAGVLRVSTVGYALPGTVIAVGILGPLGGLDHGLDAGMRTLFGVSTGLLFSGTVLALLFAYLVRFLAVAAGAFETGFSKIPRAMDQVARTLGCTKGGVLRRIHLPLLTRSAMTSFVLVFADVLKELPATLIVRPFNFDTLAVRVYQLASDERLAQASSGALVIVAIGVIPIIVLTRLSGSSAQERRAGASGPAD